MEMHTHRATKNDAQEEFLLQVNFQLSGRVMHLSASWLIELGIKAPCELLDLIYWRQGLVDLNLHMSSLLKTKKEKESLC